MIQSAFLPHVKNAVPGTIRMVALEVISAIDRLEQQAGKKDKKAAPPEDGKPEDGEPEDEQTELEGQLSKLAARFMPTEKKTALGKGGFTRAGLLAHLRGMPAGSTRRLFLLMLAGELLKTHHPELSEENALMIVAMLAG